MRNAAWQTWSRLLARIQRRCGGATALGGGEEALMHLGVATRLLEELLVMLLENVVDYVDGLVSIL